MKQLSLTKNFKKFLLVPIAVIVLCVIIGIPMGGFNFGIDFTGGTMLNIDLKKDFDIQVVEQALVDAQAQDASVSKSGAAGTTEQTIAIVRMRALDDADAEDAMRVQILETIKKTYPDAEMTSDRVSAVAGRALVNNAIWALVVAMALMMVYVWYRFEWRQGLVAIIGIAIDLAVMIAVMLPLRNSVQINSSFIAAILTVVGYDINNTIVVFDRVRETRKRMSSSIVSRAEIADASVTAVLTRTINASVTTLLTITCVYILGVPSIREFTLPIIVGILSGLYTSVFLSAPLWAIWSDKAKKKKKSATKTIAKRKRA